MIAQEVARRYAHALFDAAHARNLIDLGYEHLADLRTLLQRDRTLLTFLGAPQVLDEHKRELVRDIFGVRIHRLFVEFLVLLVDKHRVKYLPEIIDEFIDRVESAKDISRARVISAVPLSDRERADLLARLGARTGKTIRLEERVDPDILGGTIVEIQDELIDGSVRHELALIEEQLMKVKVG